MPDKNSNVFPMLYVVLIVAACALWAATFYSFLSGQQQIIDDAFPYYEHLKFYLQNLSVGIYPLWDPIRDFGVDNEFYLRRIGEFNPAYLLIILLQWFGIDFTVAHRIFLGSYFLLGCTGFYFLAKCLFKEPITYFFVTIGILFSSVGALAFQSYLLLILVPQIWFLFFVASFFQSPSKSNLLGATFCVMIISITYIPYYFLTVILCGLVAYAIIYYDSYGRIIRKCYQFIKAHTKFTLLCVLLVAIGLMPGALWYLQSSKGEMAVVYRNSGAETTNAAALHINTVKEGGIIAPKIADRMFFGLEQAQLGDFYVPLFIFILLLMAAFIGISRRMIFFFCWGLLIYFIGIADASPVHGFLYEHVFFFKYFRNLQFFLWLGILPILILLAGAIFENLFRVTFKGRPAKAFYMSYVILAHGALALFFSQQAFNTVITSTYITIIISALFFMLLPFKNNVTIRWTLPLLLLMAISVQSAQVFAYMRQNTPKDYSPSLYDNDMVFSLPKTGSIEELLHDLSPQRHLNQPFYSSNEFQDLHQNMNRSILRLYMKPRLILYDKVYPLKDDISSFSILSDSFSVFNNVAFVPPDQFQGNNFVDNTGKEIAKIVTMDSAQVQVKSFIANELDLKTSLDQPKFLVYNNVYHSKWKAFCDEKEIKIFRANHAFMGVVVPKGDHSIVFKFQETWRQWLGFGLAAIFVITFFWLIFLLCKRQQ